MTIKLTSARVIAGAVVPVNTEVTLDLAFEADLIYKGMAVRVGAAPGSSGLSPLSINRNSAGGFNVTADGKAVPGFSAPNGLPKLLVFGCSIAQQCSAYLHSTTNAITATGDIKAGATVLPVVNGAAYTAGQKITMPLYNGRLWTTTISSISSNDLTIADKLPALVRASSAVTICTTPTIPSVDQGYGAVNAAVALLGGPVEVVPAYGYGGAICVQMIADLERDLRYYRPHYVALHMYENDFTRAAGHAEYRSLEQMKAWARYMCRLCLSYGAVPIVYSSMPYYKTTPVGVPASRGADYDALAAYVGSGTDGQLSADVPGAWGDNCVSIGWLDPAYLNDGAYSRRPLAGWTDGVHPNNNKRFAVGLLTASVLQRLFPPAPTSRAELALTPLSVTRLEGTGGTATNLQSGSVVPAGYTINAAGTALITTSKNTDGSLKVVGSWPGAATLGSDYGLGLYTFTIPTAWCGSTQRFKAYIRARINSMVGISQIVAKATLDSGEDHSSFTGTDMCETIPAGGRVIVLESPSFAIGASATNVKPTFVIRPVTAGSPANAAIDIDIFELGLIPCLPETPLEYV